MASRFTLLLERYLENKASESERLELMQLLSTGQFEEQIKQGIAQQMRAEMQTDSVVHDDVLLANNAYDRAQQIVERILSEDHSETKVVPIQRAASTKRWWLAAAAAVAILLAAGYTILWTTMIAPAAEHQFMAKNAANSVFEEINEGTTQRQIVLYDSTHVTLQPGAHLIYPTQFSPTKREVYLTGEAFFEVTKDRSRPFFVYSKTLVTEVVGTSFRVRADNTVQTSEVVVMTGKVRVVQNEEDKNLLQRFMPAGKEIMLTPNHRAVYQRETEEMVMTLVEKPLPLAVDNVKASVFRAASLALVLKNLSSAYGIEIVTQNARINQCTFTGDLSKTDDLYIRLALICQSIGASYVIRDAKILITGNGC
ncbi:FecR domain-containing protein [Fulvivirgaceae bacterium PWU5]|uniref:FecR domain-containing protein n=1 Tax=Dawidia cretensis TaxID=2782350 RepID=A0AAP2E0I2_9BACT|nr:FecR family protein [Dawidia cretensis]MBT1710796.1 FecR domain-containing protein [Dawidia cretensis]